MEKIVIRGKKLQNHLGEVNFTSYQDIYARLAKDRIIFLSEDVTKETGSSLSALLLYYNSKNPLEEIKIYINSNGGDASALSNIYDVMQIVSAPISTICIGKAYSAGAILLAAGTKGRRFCTKNSEVMIHGIQAQFPQTEFADKIDSEIEMKMLLDHNDLIMRILAKHTGKSFEQVSKDCERDYYLDAEAAVQYGIVDYVF